MTSDSARPHKRTKDDNSNDHSTTTAGSSNKDSFKRLSRKPIQGGRGIFVTCIRGKQSRAAAETVDLIEQVAELVYPQERLQQLERQRIERDDNLSKSTSTSANPVNQQARSDEQSGDSQDEDLDESLEASIERELAQLKANNTNSRHRKGQAGNDDSKPKGKREKLKFESIETDTECVVYIATRWPYDPVELTHAVVQHVKATGMSQTRFTQRLSPVAFTCHASSVDRIKELSTPLIRETFQDWARRHDKTHVTYQIDPHLRNHVAPLTREVLFDLLGSIIRNLPSDETQTERRIATVAADLKAPDLVLLPTALRSVFGLSVVDGKLWKDRKFNVDLLASDARKRMQSLEGAGEQVKA
ncbi:hypothetical protein ACM66B_003996 [Microbotryomycetes sp. NB124-2]